MTSSSLVDDYSASLRELTFNSKPIIDNLTIIARENTQYADSIAAAITNRIDKCIPEQKLYTLYLLDSICKTVGPPYNGLFGKEIYRVFTHMYGLVNELIRAKLIKIYDLWKVLKEKGTNAPLFPSEQLGKICNFLRQARPHGADPQTAISQQNLIANINDLLSLLTKNLDSGDTLIPSKISALGALREYLLLQKLSQSDLKDVQEKLNQMRSQVIQNPRLESPLPEGAAAYFQAHQNVDALATSPSVSVRVEAPEPTAVGLFHDLISLGLVKVDQSLRAGSKPEYKVVIPKQKYSPQTFGETSTSFLSSLLQGAQMNQMAQHEQIKYKELVKIESKIDEKLYGSSLQLFLSNNVLDASTVQVLYETKPLKCSQCGKRFAADARGANQKKLHLDWHFRINKRHANYKTNVQSRSWYLDTVTWINFQENDLSEFESTTNKREIAHASKIPQLTYVVISSDETNMNNVCAICREHIKPNINPATEEWVWNDCMLAPGSNLGRKIVHISCFDETDRKRVTEGEGNPRIKRERFN